LPLTPFPRPRIERELSALGTPLFRGIAYQVVTNSCPDNGTMARLMLSAGFSPATEPHLKAMLLAIKSSQLKGLLKKTKIFVPKGRWLMGCLDELGILEQGQCFIQASSINNHLIKHGSRFSSANKNAVTIVGTVVVAKNPCLHPGDVRVLEAVDVPELHHLVDCLVFPKKGERPHANEASGSDLDGDVYFVTWDKNLVPPGKRNWKPMDYSPAEARQLQRRVLQHVSSTTLCTCTRFFHKMFVQLDVFTVNSIFLLFVHGFSVVLCFMSLITENIYLAMP